MSEIKSGTRVFLLRHGPVIPTALNRFNGVTDTPLDLEIGPAKAAAVADYLSDAPPEILYSSPLSRCVETARAFADRYNLEIKTLEGLQEMNFGMFEGLSFSEVRDKFWHEMTSWFNNMADYRIQGGETMIEVQKRAWTAIEELVENYEGKRIAVVAHGAVNRLIIAKALDLPIQKVLKVAMDYTSLSIIDFFDDGPVIRGMNMRPGPTLPLEMDFS